MKKYLLLLLFMPLAGYSQTADKKFSHQQLHDDLMYLKQQVYNVHIYPYTELSKDEYDQLFNGIDARLKDSLNATYFLKLIKPVIAYLSDEHSQISLKPALLSSSYQNGAIYLPFNLKKKGKYYQVDQILTPQNQLKKEDIITYINNVPVDVWVKKCALASTGFKGQRDENALVQFGYLCALANPAETTVFSIKTIKGKAYNITGTTLQMWTGFINKQSPVNTSLERITYKKHGSVGYINAASFYLNGGKKSDIDSMYQTVSAIFKQIQDDRVSALIIDVSRNEGGSSMVGDWLIDFIYNKPYKGYQSAWKRSDEYLKLLGSWGIHDSTYAAASAGSILKFPANIITPSGNNYRFKGKVYVVTGYKTFSSAMLFATTVKDNRIATLIGQTPVNGHPNGFGEMYNTQLPNTKIDVRFGVKEWIRPAGKNIPNVLIPDVSLTSDEVSDPNKIIKRIEQAYL